MCCVGRVVVVVCGKSPHRVAWVRVHQCAGVMLWCPPRTLSLASWGVLVFPYLCLAVYVLCVRYFYLRGRGLYLHLSLRVV